MQLIGPRARPLRRRGGCAGAAGCLALAGLLLAAPPADAAVPWLQLDNKTKLPKGDLPIGRQASSVGPLILSPGMPETRMSANVPFDSRRM